MAENCSKGLSCGWQPQGWQMGGLLMAAAWVRLYHEAAPSSVAYFGPSAWNVVVLTDIPPYWKVRMFAYRPPSTAASSAALEKL